MVIALRMVKIGQAARRENRRAGDVPEKNESRVGRDFGCGEDCPHGASGRVPGRTLALYKRGSQLISSVF